MYITVLDFRNGEVNVHDIEENVEPEVFLLEEGYSLDYVQWMVTPELNYNDYTK